MLNPFKVENVSSCRYPITKLLISSAIIALMCLRKSICARIGATINPLANVACGVIGCAALWCIITSVVEIATLCKTKQKQQKRVGQKETYSYSLETLYSLVEKNDIIEIIILFDGRRVTVGSSAESDRGSSRFYNKEYYIDSRSFCSFEEFRQEMRNMFQDDAKIRVVEIDGVSPKYYS